MDRAPSPPSPLEQSLALVRHRRTVVQLRVAALAQARGLEQIQHAHRVTEAVLALLEAQEELDGRVVAAIAEIQARGGCAHQEAEHGA